MDWEEYADTGMLDAEPGARHIDEGVIKPTYAIDADSDSYILQTVYMGEEHRLHKQREIYQRLGDMDVPVPEVVHDATAGDVPYQVVETIDGGDLEPIYQAMEPDEATHLLDQAARYLAEAHGELEQEGYGRMIGTEEGIEIVGDQDWRSFFRAFMQNQIDIIENSALDSDGLAGRAEQALDETIDRVPEDPGAAVCHEDYRPGNMIGTGDEIRAVLDWDNAFSGDPQYDVARAERAFTYHLPEDDEERLSERFRAVYEEKGGSIDEEIHGIYQLGVLIDTGASFAWLDDNGYSIDDETFEDHASLIETALSDIEERY